MAADGFTAWLVLFSCVTVICFSASTHTRGNAPLQPIKRLFRNKRQDECPDGSYSHEGRTCCLCAAGQKLVKHCHTKPDDGQCESCQFGMYSSHPTSQAFCVPCTSCDHPNANLELDVSCSLAQDAKCRCKKDHYCSSATEICRLCNPCKECGAEGVKIACTSTNNTVCNQITGGGKTQTNVIIIVTILLFVCAAVAVYCCWKRKMNKKKGCQPHSYTDVNLQQFNDLQPHLSDIAEVLGWKDMKDIAMRTGMSKTKIESCQLDHPGESQEQTLQLLMDWVEKEGSGGSNKLIQILQRIDKRGKAERVMEILKHE